MAVKLNKSTGTTLTILLLVVWLQSFTSFAMPNYYSMFWNNHTECPHGRGSCIIPEGSEVCEGYCHFDRVQCKEVFYCYRNIGDICNEKNPEQKCHPNYACCGKCKLSHQCQLMHSPKPIKKGYLWMRL